MVHMVGTNAEMYSRADEFPVVFTQ